MQTAWPASCGAAARHALDLAHPNACIPGCIGSIPHLGAALGSQCMIPTGMTAKRTVNRMVAHCCDANTNLKFIEPIPHALRPFSANEFDLCTPLVKQSCEGFRQRRQSLALDD